MIRRGTAGEALTNKYPISLHSDGKWYTYDGGTNFTVADQVGICMRTCKADEAFPVMMEKGIIEDCPWGGNVGKGQLEAVGDDGTLNKPASQSSTNSKVLGRWSETTGTFHVDISKDYITIA